MGFDPEKLVFFIGIQAFPAEVGTMLHAVK